MKLSKSNQSLSRCSFEMHYNLISWGPPKKVCDQFLRNLCMRQISSTLDKYPLTQFDKCINFMCNLFEENSCEVFILLARGSLPEYKTNGAQILYSSLFTIAFDCLHLLFFYIISSLFQKLQLM